MLLTSLGLPWVISSPIIFSQKNAIITPGASTRLKGFKFGDTQNGRNSRLAQSHYHDGSLPSHARRYITNGLHHSWLFLQSTFLHRHTEPGIFFRLSCACHASPGLCVRCIILPCLIWFLHQVHTSTNGLPRWNLIIWQQTKPHPYFLNFLSSAHQIVSCCSN